MCGAGFWLRSTFSLIKVELILHYSLCSTYYIIAILLLQTESFKKINLNMGIHLETAMLYLG